MALLLFSSTFQTSPRAFAPPPAPCVLASPFWDRRRIHSILPYITPGWGGTRRERETRHTCIIPDWHLLPSETRSCWLMGLHGLWKGRACDSPPQPKGISSTRLPGPREEDLATQCPLLSCRTHFSARESPSPSPGAKQMPNTFCDSSGKYGIFSPFHM